MTIDFDAIGADIARIGADANVIFPALGRIYAQYGHLEPATKASLIADAQALAAQFTMISAALQALENDNDMQKMSGAIQLVSTVSAAIPVAMRVKTNLQSVLGADYAVIKPDVITVFNTLKGTAT